MKIYLFCFSLQTAVGDGGSGSISPGLRLYSQSYPSLYSPAAAAAGVPAAQHGTADSERERATLGGMERATERTGIAELEEDDDEDGEDDDLDGRRRNLNESAGALRRHFLFTDVKDARRFNHLQFFCFSFYASVRRFLNGRGLGVT